MSLTVKIVEYCEDVAENAFKISKNYLPLAARLLFTATFIDDGIRLLLQFSIQQRHVQNTLGCSEFLAWLHLLISIYGQLGGVAMILARYHVEYACALVAVSSTLQPMLEGLGLYWMLRLSGMLGTLFMIVAETKLQPKSVLDNESSSQDEKLRTFLLLAGRIFIVAMFLPIFISSEQPPRKIVEDLVALALIISISVGYKTKLCALIVALLLCYINVTEYRFWEYSDEMRDMLTYEFFQIVSITGGVLLIVLLGPGPLSLDERKIQ